MDEMEKDTEEQKAKISRLAVVSLLLSILGICLLVLITTSSAIASKNDSKGFSEQEILAEFTIAKNGDIILLPVRFKGEEHLFLLDTGFTCTVFDSSFKSELGSRIGIAEVKTMLHSVAMDVYEAPEAFLGPLSISDLNEVICNDLKMLSLICGKEIGGIVGMNFSKKHAVQIDFDNGKLYFLKPSNVQNPQWGEAFAIKYIDGCPYITVEIFEGIKVDLLVDTGNNSSGSLRTKIIRELASKKNLTTTEKLVATAAGVYQEGCVCFENISIGSFNYKDIIISEAAVNTLGLGILSRHLVTFDFPNKRIYLRKGKDFQKSDELDMSGLHLLKVSNSVLVYSIDKSSPAQKAGINANDTIIMVEGKDANSYDMWELRRLLRSKDKRNITMTIKHGDDVKEVSFVLEKKI